MMVSARRLAYECAFFSGALAIGLVWAWEDTLTEKLCAVVMVIAWLVMNGGSPLGWLLVIATTCVTEQHWSHFVSGTIDTFGGIYDGYGGWALGLYGWVIFVVIYVVHGVMLLPFDLWHYAHEMAKSIKIQPSVNLAGLRPGRLVSTLAVNAVIVLVYVGAATAHSVWSNGSRGIRFTRAADGQIWTLPNKQEQLICFLCGLLWNEVMFYYSHRLLHQQMFYVKLHKKHHEYTAPFALAAIYCGPVEMVVSNLWPFLGIVSVWRFHLFFTYCWVANAIMGTQTHHSGYKWPWMTVLDHQPNVHDLHHELFNCNFGNVGILDYLHGTARDHEAHYKQRALRDLRKSK